MAVCAFVAADEIKDKKSSRPDATYAETIAPIMNRSCVSCHRTGGIAPFSLVGYDNTKKWIATIASVTQSGYMPPWKAVHGYGDFKDENRLSKMEIDQIQQWNETGMPRGDESKEPASPKFVTNWPLRQPDLIVQPEKSYHVDAEGGDLYRSFVIKNQFKKPTWIKAIAIQPGNAKVVHHVIVFTDATGMAQESEVANTDGQPGFVDSGGAPGFIPSGVLGTWAPGATTREFPAGTAMLVSPKDKIVIQVHYHKTGKPEEDQTKLGLYFATEKIKHRMLVDWIMDVDLRIPADDNHYVESYDQTVDENMTIYSAFPHMHNLGQSLKAEIRYPDGKIQPLIWVDKWDFRWQLTYSMKDPIKAPKGSVIHIDAVYDNSAANVLNPHSPPKRVKFGRRTTDEMLLLVLDYALDKS